MKQIESLLKHDLTGQYDTRKGLNRSSVKIPDSVIEDLEAGKFTSEMIDSLTVPVFKYRTQITLHGLWNYQGQGRIGGYKNLVLNQNETLGVRYSAIDAEKVREIVRLLRYSGSRWRFYENSQDRQFTYHEEIKTAEELHASRLKLTGIAEIIKTLPAFGSVHLYVAADIFGRKFVCLDLNLEAIYQKDLPAFTEALFNTLDGPKTYQELKRAKDEKEAQQAAENAETAQRISEQNKKKNEALQVAQDQIRHLRPASFTGTIVRAIVTDRLQPAFRFYRIGQKGSFGRYNVDTAISLTLNPENWKPLPKQIKPSELALSNYKQIG